MSMIMNLDKKRTSIIQKGCIPINQMFIDNSLHFNQLRDFAPINRQALYFT